MSLWRESFWAVEFWSEDFWRGIADVDLGVALTNANATTDVPTNINACQISGFKQYPEDMRITWDGKRVRKESFDYKHPQLMVRSVSEGIRRGPLSPEPDDTFVSGDYDPSTDL